ncbi:hypothetical protein Cantr_00298 [Candida viswanathii]|uniref:Uncharacterized protein n=1 Tax=Candida viswanathii TaxID=5486 RepID=A0A367YGI4_9ASCO|nr:hypothetical protein Cantr_00298 [Candida viswanathii]
MAKAKTSIATLYTKFPFSQCHDHHLCDTLNLIKHGVNLTIQLGTLDLQEIEQYENSLSPKPTAPPPKDQLLEDLLDDYDEDLDYEADEEAEDLDYHLPPSPILIPTELPKSSMKRRHSSTSSTSSSGTNLSLSSSPISQIPSDMTLLICRNKLQHLIDEFFQCVSGHDHKNYQEISNYVINSIVQNEPSLESFVNKIIDYKFKSELIEIIKTLFVEKFEETKLEALIDFLNNLINLRVSSIKDLEKPTIYSRYYRIWRLGLTNYRFYEEEYFFDYFNNSYSNLESVLLQNGFLINYKKFVHYFSKDLTNYDDDDDEEDDDEEEGEDELEDIEEEEPQSPPLHFQVTANGTPELLLDLSLNETPKLLRFNDDINVININRYLPVDHVLYNQFIKEVE